MAKRMLCILLAVSVLFSLTALTGRAAEGDVERCELYAESNLLRMGYSDLATRTELAVGDTLDVLYESVQPAEVTVNGEVVHRFAAGQFEHYAYRIAAAEPVEIVVRQGENELIARRFTVISSAEMYRKELQRCWAELKTADLSWVLHPKEALDAGINIFSPFLPAAVMITFAVNFCNVFFSFFRIVR